MSCLGFNEGAKTYEPAWVRRLTEMKQVHIANGEYLAKVDSCLYV